MLPKPKLFPCALLSLLLSSNASALVVEVQGNRLEPQSVGASCIDITGEYPGIRIEPSAAGKTARICYNSNRVNSLSVLNATLVAKEPIKQQVIIRFEHSFPAGINGKVNARVNLQGFFSTSSGVGIPSGNKLAVSALFVQNGHEDPIGEPLDLTVGSEMDTALFDYSAKEQYLIAGPRSLKGVLKIVFTASGNKLTFPEKGTFSLDTSPLPEERSMPIDIDTVPVSTPEPGSVPEKPSIPAPAAAAKVVAPPAPHQLEPLKPVKPTPENPAIFTQEPPRD